MLKVTVAVILKAIVFPLGGRFGKMGIVKLLGKAGLTGEKVPKVMVVLPSSHTTSPQWLVHLDLLGTRFPECVAPFCTQIFLLASQFVPEGFVTLAVESAVKPIYTC